MCKKRVSILTTEDSAPLRSRAIRRLVFVGAMPSANKMETGVGKNDKDT